MRKAEQRETPDGYTEKHHVFPKSVYGENNRLVSLTAREHYIAHALLDKGFTRRYGLKHNKSIRMIHAHVTMTWNRHGQRYVNSRLFESARIRQAQVTRGVARSQELKDKMSEARLKTGRYTGEAEERWLKGATKGGVAQGKVNVESGHLAKVSQMNAERNAEKRQPIIDRMIEVQSIEATHKERAKMCGMTYPQYQWYRYQYM